MAGRTDRHTAHVSFPRLGLKLAVCALLAVLIIGAALPAGALPIQQESPIRLSIDVGFDGYFRSGAWVPVRINVSNDGADIQGELRASASDLYGSPVDVYSVPIDLPTQSAKQVFLYLPLNEASQEVRVELATAQHMLADAVQDVHPARGADLLLAVLSESPRGGVDLTGIPVPFGTARQTNWRVESVPPRGDALGGLDMLVLTDADTGALDADQRQAVRDWVMAGGHLVVTGGPNWQKTRAGVAEILPLQPTGATTLTSLPTLAAYAGDTGETLAAPDGGTIVVARGRLVPEATILVEESGLPILSRLAYGSGLVDYLAVDPGLDPLQGWDARGALWSKTLAPSGQRPGWAGGITGAARAEVAADMISGLRLPDVLQLVLFLGIYILVVGPLNYLLLRRIGRRELAWLTIPLVVVGASVIYYVSGNNLRGTQAIVNQLVLIQSWPGGERAQVDGILGVLSPRRETYTVEAQAGIALRAPNTSPADGALGKSSLSITGGARYEARDVRVDAGTTMPMLMSGYVAQDSLEGSAVITVPVLNPIAAQVTGQIDETGRPRGQTAIRGTLHNTTGLRLESAVVLVMGSALHLGTLEPGDVRDFELQLGADRAVPVWPEMWNTSTTAFTRFSRVLVQADQTVRDIMGDDFSSDRAPFGGRGFENTPERQESWRRQMFLQALIEDIDSSGGRGTNVYIAGWTRESPIDVRLENAPYLQEETALYIFRLPVRVATETVDGTAAVPNAYLTWTPATDSPRQDVAPYDLRLQPGEWAIFHLQPMPLMRLDDVTAAELFIRAGSSFSSQRGEISLWNWQESAWEIIPQSAPLIRIEGEVGRFVGPENLVQMKVTAQGATGSVFYERIDLNLYGRLANASN